MKKFIVTMAIEEFRDFEIEAESIEEIENDEYLYDKLAELMPVDVRAIQEEEIADIEEVN